MSQVSLTDTANTEVDIADCRADFPALSQQINGHPIAFLDSAASSQQPSAVIDTIREYQRHDHANVHRGVYTLSHRATEAYEGARDRITAFINAASRSEVIYTSAVTPFAMMSWKALMLTGSSSQMALPRSRP